MQRLMHYRKRIIIGLLLLTVVVLPMIPAAAQDGAVNGDIYIATNEDDGRLVVFGMDGGQADVIADETYDAVWHGWRLSSQEIMLYTDDQSDDIASPFAVVDAEGLRFVEMDAELGTMFRLPQIVNYVAPYLVIVTDVDSEYSPALLVNVDAATADILTMDYPLRTPFRLSEDGATLRFAEHGDAVTEQNIVELDLDSGEKTVVNVADSNGRLYPDRYGETWVEILPTPINPQVTLYDIDGNMEEVADGTQEAFYWVVGNYLVNNTDSCSGGNCLYEFRSLRDDVTVSITAPEGIGFGWAQTLDDGRIIVPDMDTQAYWLLTVLHDPTQLGYSAAEIGTNVAFGRLSPDEQWFVVESVPSPGDPAIAIQIMNVDAIDIVGTIGGNGSIHGILYGDNGILIELLNTKVLFNISERTIGLVPHSNDTDYHAVLADNLLLYSLEAREADMRAGVYVYSPTSEESTLLFEDVHVLELK